LNDVCFFAQGTDSSISNTIACMKKKILSVYTANWSCHLLPCLSRANTCSRINNKNAVYV
jgi:hypothetical protein